MCSSGLFQFSRHSQLHIQSHHKIGAGHGEIKVFGGHGTTILIAIGIPVRCIFLIENIIHLHNERRFFEQDFTQRITDARVLYKIRIEAARFIGCIIEVLTACKFSDQTDLKIIGL